MDKMRLRERGVKHSKPIRQEKPVTPHPALDARHWALAEYHIGESGEKREVLQQVLRNLAMLQEIRISCFREGVVPPKGLRLSPETILTPAQRSIRSGFVRDIPSPFVVRWPDFILPVESVLAIEECDSKDALDVLVTAANTKMKCPSCLKQLKRDRQNGLRSDPEIDPGACFKHSFGIVTANHFPLLHQSQAQRDCGENSIYDFFARLCPRYCSAYLVLVREVEPGEQPNYDKLRCGVCKSVRVSRYFDYYDALNLVCNVCNSQTVFDSESNPQEPRNRSNAAKWNRAKLLANLLKVQPPFEMIDLYKNLKTRKVAGYAYVT